MKTKKTKEDAAAASASGRVKIKNLKLAKETVPSLSDVEAKAVKGGGRRTRISP